MTTFGFLYWSAPNREHKGADELRQAKARAYVGRDRKTKRNPFTGKHRATAPGYVIADRVVHLPYAKYVRPMLDPVTSTVKRLTKDELGRLYLARMRIKAPSTLFKIGDKVTVLIGAFAEMPGTISEHRRNGYMVHVPLLGKTCSVFVPEQYLKRHIDPG